MCGVCARVCRTMYIGTRKKDFFLIYSKYQFNNPYLRSGNNNIENSTSQFNIPFNERDLGLDFNSIRFKDSNFLLMSLLTYTLNLVI